MQHHTPKRNVCEHTAFTMMHISYLFHYFLFHSLKSEVGLSGLYSLNRADSICETARHRKRQSIRIKDSYHTLIRFILPLVILILFQCQHSGYYIGRFSFNDMLKTQVASTCASCLPASVPKLTSSNT